MTTLQLVKLIYILDTTDTGRAHQFKMMTIPSAQIYFRCLCCSLYTVGTTKKFDIKIVGENGAILLVLNLFRKKGCFTDGVERREAASCIVFKQRKTAYFVTVLCNARLHIFERNKIGQNLVRRYNG